MKKISLMAGAVLMALTPVLAFAQERLTGTSNILWSLGNIINMGVVILGSVALLVFFWGVVKYISASGDPKKAAEGKGIMIWGAVALFVMFSIFGIVRWLRGEFGINANQNMDSPQVNIPGGSGGSGGFGPTR